MSHLIVRPNERRVEVGVGVSLRLLRDAKSLVSIMIRIIRLEDCITDHTLSPACKVTTFLQLLMFHLGERKKKKCKKTLFSNDPVWCVSLGRTPLTAPNKYFESESVFKSCKTPKMTLSYSNE